MQENYITGPGINVGNIEINKKTGLRATVNGKSVNVHTTRSSLYGWSF